MPTYNFGNLSKALEYVQPTAVQYADDSDDMTALNPACENSVPGYPSRLSSRSVGQIKTWHANFQMLLTAEAETGLLYDFVIHARPDVAFLGPLQSWDNWKVPDGSSKAGWYPFDPGTVEEAYNVGRAAPVGAFGGPACFNSIPADHFNIFTRDAADVMFRLYEKYQGCTGDTMHEAYCCGGGPTGALQYAGQHEPNMAYIKTQFPIHLIRPRWVADGTNPCDGYRAIGDSWDYFSKCTPLRPVPGCHR